MYGSTVAVTTSSEASAHLPHSNVTAHPRAAERPKTEGAGKRVVLPTGGAVSTPNAYMLLLSRLDNMVRRNAVDSATLEQLRTHIAQHLAILPAHSRQKVQQMEGFAALGVERFTGLPEAIVRNLRDSAKAPAVMNFLKQADFVAYMRDEPRGSLYSAQGILKAS